MCELSFDWFGTRRRCEDGLGRGTVLFLAGMVAARIGESGLYGPSFSVVGDRDEESWPLSVSVGAVIVQELCESRGGRPGLSVLTSLLVSVDVKLY